MLPMVIESMSNIYKYKLQAKTESPHVSMHTENIKTISAERLSNECKYEVTKKLSVARKHFQYS